MNRREQLLKRLDQAWCAFRESYADLSDGERLQPGVIGTWSVKDIIAHVAVWEEEALKHLPLILDCGKPPRYSVTYGGIDAFNAQTMQKKEKLSLPEVLRQSEAVHRQVVSLVENAPEEQLGAETRFRRRLRLDTYGHYPKHAKAIRKWRERQASLHVPGPPM
ncbi:MAG TPA: DinB family protein [Bryobacteraceae bacterium]|nr:DinB family protein [Bryobacteraceae bacterium]